MAAGSLDPFVAEHGAALRAFLRRRAPRSRVDDIFQDVWLAASKALPTLVRVDSPRAWLFGVAYHKLADHRASARFDSLTSELSQPGPLGALIGVRRARTPVSVALEHERAERLEAALRTLEPLDRELLLLRYVEGRMPAEIVELASGVGEASASSGPSELLAGLATLNANAVAQRLVRAAKRLRQALVEPTESS